MTIKKQRKYLEYLAVHESVSDDLPESQNPFDLQETFLSPSNHV